MNTLIRNARAIFFAPESSSPNTAAGNKSQQAAGDIRIRDGLICEIGTQLLPADDEQIIDATGCVVWPGLVNTHHHLAQSVLKGVPEGLNQALGDWLGSVPYRFWMLFQVVLFLRYFPNDPKLTRSFAPNGDRVFFCPLFMFGLCLVLLSGRTSGVAQTLQHQTECKQGGSRNHHAGAGRRIETERCPQA